MYTPNIFWKILTLQEGLDKGFPRANFLASSASEGKEWPLNMVAARKTEAITLIILL